MKSVGAVALVLLLTCCTNTESTIEVPEADSLAADSVQNVPGIENPSEETHNINSLENDSIEPPKHSGYKSSVFTYQIGRTGLRIRPDSINGKEIDYYLNGPNVHPNAMAMINEEFHPSDEMVTFDLLEFILNNDQDLLPFYNHVWNITFLTSDGALSEWFVGNAWEYLEKYPDVIFEQSNAYPDSTKKTILATYSGYIDTDVSAALEFDSIGLVTQIDDHFLRVKDNCSQDIWAEELGFYRQQLDSLLIRY